MAARCGGSGAGATIVRRIVPGCVLFALILFITNSAGTLAAPFGESHDGRNAATWGSASRAIREDGLVASRFGGVTAAGPYASHPPMIVAQVTVAELVGGERRAVTRMPAWVGSAAVLVLLARLLLRLGLSPPAAASGVLLVVGSAMFLAYGTMLDTPVTSTAFVLALLGTTAGSDRERHPAVLGVLGFLAAASGWLALLFVGSEAARAALARRRRDAVVLAAAAGLGFATTFTWARWTYGSLATLTEKFTARTSAVPLTDSLAKQVADAIDLLPALLLVGLGGAAWGRRRVAGAFGWTLAPVVAYGILFSGGAHEHDYWNFNLVVPLSIGAACGVDAALDALDRERRPTLPLLLPMTFAALALLAAMTGSPAERRTRNGLHAEALLDEAAAIAGHSGPILGVPAPEAIDFPWVRYESGRPSVPLEDPEAMEAFAREHPDVPVLVAWPNLPPERRSLALGLALAVDGPFLLLDAAEAPRLLRS